MSVVKKHQDRGHIPAKCTKGELTDDITIPLK